MDEIAKLKSQCRVSGGKFQEFGSFSAACFFDDNMVSVDTLKNRVSIKLDLTPFNLGISDDLFINIDGKLREMVMGSKGVAAVMRRIRDSEEWSE